MGIFGGDMGDPKGVIWGPIKGYGDTSGGGGRGSLMGEFGDMGNPKGIWGPPRGYGAIRTPKRL